MRSVGIYIRMVLHKRTGEVQKYWIDFNRIKRGKFVRFLSFSTLTKLGQTMDG
jgi:hypothetical protein